MAEKEDGNSFRILSDVKDAYMAPDGAGIHPREASRHHEELCSAIVGKSLLDAQLRVGDLDFVSYSAGPGLGPCLRVGAVLARTISSYFDLPLVAANHAIGHIELGKYLTGVRDPLVLIISGGHTALAAMEDGAWKIFGETLDLTLGQLLDLLGRSIGFSSPAGQKIEQLALAGGSGRFLLSDLPYTIKGNDVSYSGLLTASKSLLSRENRKEDVAFAVQEVAFSILAEATERALAFTMKSELLVTGGVAANQRLAAILWKMCDARRVRLGVIPRQFAGDCGAQIAAVGFDLYDRRKTISPINAFTRQSWRIDQVAVN